MRALQGAALTLVCAIAVATAAQASPIVAPSALDAAQAMSSQPGLVTGGSYVLQPTDGTGAPAPTVAISSDPVLGMPSHGPAYTVLSSGNAVSDMQYTGDQAVGAYVSAAGTEAHSYSTSDIQDLTVLEATIDVPSSDNCLGF